MGGKRKSTADGKTPLSKVRSDSKSVAKPSPAVVDAPVLAASSAEVLAGGAVAVAGAEEGEVVKLLDSDVPKTVLRCDKCHGPLKPPVYQCSRMLHVACGDCGGGGGGECRPCANLSASAVYVQNAYLDTLFGYTKVACPYKKYGCASSVAYRDSAAHAAACACAPCSCEQCLFQGSPADLVHHFTEESGRHAWTAHKITYGKDHRYVFDALDSDEDAQRRLLVAEDDDGVFLLDICYHDKDFHFVALACVKTEAGAGTVYSSSVAVEGPPGITVKMEQKVVPSCPVPAVWQYNYYEALTVHPEMLHGEQIKKLHICVCISKTESISE
ncbi:hypothetical protein ACQJBY_055979 [Aegilops geniculata]